MPSILLSGTNKEMNPPGEKATAIVHVASDVGNKKRNLKSANLRLIEDRERAGGMKEGEERAGASPDVRLVPVTLRPTAADFPVRVGDGTESLVGERQTPSARR